MTATGSTSCAESDQPPPGSSVAVPGSQPSQTTKTLARKTPSANSGIEATTVPNIRMARSSREASRMPATTPSTVESGTMHAKAIAASMAVFARCLKRTAFTGSLKRVE